MAAKDISAFFEDWFISHPHVSKSYFERACQMGQGQINKAIKKVKSIPLHHQSMLYYYTCEYGLSFKGWVFSNANFKFIAFNPNTFEMRQFDDFAKLSVFISDLFNNAGEFDVSLKSFFR